MMICLVGRPDLGHFPITPLEQLALEGKFVQAVDDIYELTKDNPRWQVVADAMRILEQGPKPCTS